MKHINFYKILKNNFKATNDGPSFSSPQIVDVQQQHDSQNDKLNYVPKQLDVQELDDPSLQQDASLQYLKKQEYENSDSNQLSEFTTSNEVNYVNAKIQENANEVQFNSQQRFAQQKQYIMDKSQQQALFYKPQNLSQQTDLFSSQQFNQTIENIQQSSSNVTQNNTNLQHKGSLFQNSTKRMIKDKLTGHLKPMFFLDEYNFTSLYTKQNTTTLRNLTSERQEFLAQQKFLNEQLHNQTYQNMSNQLTNVNGSNIIDQNQTQNQVLQNLANFNGSDNQTINQNQTSNEYEMKILDAIKKQASQMAKMAIQAKKNKENQQVDIKYIKTLVNGQEVEMKDLQIKISQDQKKLSELNNKQINYQDHPPSKYNKTLEYIREKQSNDNNLKINQNQQKNLDKKQYSAEKSNTNQDEELQLQNIEKENIEELKEKEQILQNIEAQNQKDIQIEEQALMKDEITKKIESKSESTVTQKIDQKDANKIELKQQPFQTIKILKK